MALRAVQHGRSLALSSWHAGRWDKGRFDSSHIAIFQRGRPATTWDAARATLGYPTSCAPKGKIRSSAGARPAARARPWRRKPGEPGRVPAWELA
jgi:hypothetical protein